MLILGPQSPLAAVAAAWLSWIESRIRQAQTSPRTLRNYRRSVPRFGALLSRPVHEITCQDVLAWHEGRCRNTTSATAKADHTALRACLSYARRRDLVKDNPASRLGITHKVAPPNPMRPNQVVLYREALGRFTARRVRWVGQQSALSELEAHAYLSAVLAAAFLELSGRRLKEVCDLLVAQVRLANSHSCIILPTTKTGPSVIPLAGDLEQLVRDQLAALDGRCEHLFPSPRNLKRPIADKTVWETHHEICGMAGLSGIRPHDLRHGYAFAALAGGARLDDLSRTLGHRSVLTTQRVYGTGVFITPGMFEVAALVQRVKANGGVS